MLPFTHTAAFRKWIADILCEDRRIFAAPQLLRSEAGRDSVCLVAEEKQEEEKKKAFCFRGNAAGIQAAEPSY